MKSFALVALIVLTCLVSTARAETFEQRLEFKPGGNIEIENVAGSIDVRGWNRNQVEVVIELSSRKDVVDFEVDGDTAYVAVRKDHDRHERKRHHGQYGKADMVIRVPRDTRVAVHAVSANVTVLGVSGRQRLESVSGDIISELDAAEGGFRSVSGDIEVRATGRKPERVTAATVSGDIVLTKVAGEIRVNTVSGDIEIDAEKFQRLDGESVSGDLRVSGDLQSGGRVSFESVNGDLVLEVASLYDTEFDLESFNGSISPIFEHRAERTSRYAPGRELRLTEGSGATEIRIETLNGDIEIRGKKSGRSPRINVIRALRPGSPEQDD